MKTGSIEESTRVQLAEFLPRALKKALASYHEHMDQNVDDEDFCFSTYHKDAKVAISHVELLIKLAKRVDQESPDAGVPLLPDDIMLLAEGDIARFREQDSE